jgi:hypothetical protein
MYFTGDFSNEQELALHEVIRETENLSDEPRQINFQNENIIKRSKSLTITAKNFFQIYSEPNFRSLDTFCNYIVKADYEDLIALNEIFQIMNNDLYFELVINKSLNMFEIFVYSEGIDEAEQLELGYDPAIHHLLHQYVNRQVNIKVTLEELLTLVGDFTGLLN